METTLADIVYDFHYACTSGDLSGVRKALKINGLKNHSNAETYLYEGLGYAVRNNQHNIVEYLLFSDDFKKHIQYDGVAFFPFICKDKTPEVVQVVINDMNKKNIPIPYTQGFINACDNDNIPVLELLLSQEAILNKIPIDIQLKKFEDAIKQDSLELVKFFLLNEHLQFNILCGHYLRRKKIGFDPFTPRMKMSKPIQSFMGAYELENQLRVNLPTSVTKKPFKI